MSRRYRHRIRLVRDQSADGVQVPDYQAISSGFPCRIVPKMGWEAQRGKQLEASVSHVIELRWYDSFKPNDVVENEDDGIRFNVKSVINEDGAKREMMLYCDQVVV